VGLKPGVRTTELSSGFNRLSLTHTPVAATPSDMRLLCSGPTPAREPGPERRSFLSAHAVRRNAGRPE
ncbi:hypothetical protein, partial [Acetobacter oeni]|uniref:hypothetical protein n=1 Tax=Acetobacter oeni TaxID=304077 RepID=UPI00223133BB